MRHWLHHPWALWAARLILAGTFLAAALPKLADPPGFAKAIWAYGLVPQAALAPMALVLPWLELLCALALMSRAWLRAGLLWLGGLLLVFCLALGVNLARGQAVDCGCFGTSAPKTHAQRLAAMGWDLGRDLLLLLLVLQVATGTAAGIRPEARRSP